MNSTLMMGVSIVAIVIYLVSVVMVFRHYRYEEKASIPVSTIRGIFSPILGIIYVMANSL